MKMTTHAIKRKTQRGFNDIILEVIEQNGSYQRAPGGAIKIFFGKKEHKIAVNSLKKTIQLLDKAKGGTLIYKDNEVITMFKKN